MSNDPSVSVVENPYDDDVTKAYSRLDFLDGEVALYKGELRERLQRKVGKYKQAAVDAKDALTAHDETVRQMVDERDQAKAVVDEVSAANPDLAAEVRARRKAANAALVADLRAELAKLEGN